MQRFSDGARVVFIGDSITAANNFVARVFDYYRTELASAHVTFKNSGVSGGSTRSALDYLEPDVFPFEPTDAVIMLGVNDSNRTVLEQPDSAERRAGLDRAYDTYRVKLRELCDKLTERGIKLTLCTPAPYAEFLATEQPPLVGGHALILRYAEYVRALARELGCGLVDYHARMSELYLDEPLYNADHVHPNDLGHARMAECLLAAQGLTPRELVLGQPPEPISSELAGWREATAKIRTIYAVEWMIVKNYALPDSEKLALVRDYVDGKKWGDFLYFEGISKAYLVDKPNERQIVEYIEREAERLANGK